VIKAGVLCVKHLWVVIIWGFVHWYEDDVWRYMFIVHNILSPPLVPVIYIHIYIYIYISFLFKLILISKLLVHLPSQIDFFLSSFFSPRVHARLTSCVWLWPCTSIFCHTDFANAFHYLLPTSIASLTALIEQQLDANVKYIGVYLGVLCVFYLFFRGPVGRQHYATLVLQFPFSIIV
jgi:hypothetical protein